ncbi:MAG: TolC family protein [Cytophagales bacterium]|nr:TolC family protein [Cytophagales bacterium]
MRKKISLILFFAVTFSQAGVQAQDNSGKTWTLQECIEYGVKHNLQVQGAKLQVEVNRISVKQAKLRQLPSLNASFGNTMSWGRSLDQTTYEYKDQRLYTNNTGLNSSVNLVNGFQIRNRIKQAEYEAEASHFGLKKTENDIRLKIATAYLNTLYVQELRSVAVSELESIKKQRDRTKALVDAGAKPKTDLLHMESQVATREVDLVRRQNELNAALLNLKQTMQLPDSEKFSVAVPEITVEGLALEAASADYVYNQALLVLPEVMKSELDVKSANAALANAFVRFLPSLSLNAGIGTRYSDGQDSYIDGVRRVKNEFGAEPIGLLNNDKTQVVYSMPRVVESDQPIVVDGYSMGKQYKDNLGYSVSLSLSFPIFNGYSIRSAYQRSKIEKQQQELQRKQVDNQLRQEIEKVYNDAQASLKVYQSAQKQVESLEETFKAQEKRYNLGAVSFVDYQVAQTDFVVAQSQLIQAKYDYIFKTKVLDFYLGKPLSF